MMLTSDKIGLKRALPRSATPLLPRAGYRARRVAANAFEQSECQETSRRDLLVALSILGSFTVVQSAQAATDLYEELRSITASRSGSTSLMESFNSTRDSVAAAAAKTNRGIRERLAAEASDAPKPSSSSSPSSGGFKFSTPVTPAKPAAPAAPAAPKASSGSGFNLFGSSSGPKPQAPKPQAPKPAPAAPKAAAAAAGSGSGGGVLFPVIQAAGVLGLVGLGANAVTSFATSNKKGSKDKSTPASAAAPTSGTSKAKAGTGKLQSSNTAKISVNKPAAAQGTRSASRKVAAGAAAAAGKTERIVKKAPGAAAAATGTVKDSIKQALVNSEQPDEPTDFALAGILGSAAVLGAFFIFGLPQPQVIEPAPSSQANDPLVELAKEGGFSAASKSTYKNPLFKSSNDSNSAADRRVIAAATPAPAVKEAPAPAPAPAAAAAKAAEAAKAAAAAAPKIEVPPVPKVELPVPPQIEVPSPPKVEVPAVPKLEDAVPAPAAAVASKIADAVKSAPAATTEAVENAAPAVAAKVEAPKPAAAVTAAVKKAEEAKSAAAAAPAAAMKKAEEAKSAAAAAPAAAVKKAEEAKSAAAAAPATAAKEAQQQGANPLFLGLAGLGVVVGALAVVGNNNSSATEGASSTSTTTAAAPTTTAGSEGSAPAAEGSDSSSGATAAETVSAAASTAAASAPGQGAPGDNAAYEQAVNALFSDPDTADDLYSIIQPALRNAPALAWALVSNATNAETLDGWAFQKLSTARYERVRGLLVAMGLQLPDTPKAQPVINMTTPAGTAELDPEKLRAVFEALLANPASRTLMKKLLSGAGMPFNEDAFEEQIKDATYFNLAIAPILRKMPPQKLAVLADLQDPAKLQELVRSVSNLAADTVQLEAVTAELSGDVRSTVDKIRETEGSTTTTAASR